jgi:DNA invertase Pin-like site-specific DNA recombinase
VSDFCALVERSRREGWQLSVLDLGVDTSTATGELIAHVMASLAQFERRLVGERTSAALQALKARGVRLGRPVRLPTAVRDRIVQARQDGSTLQAIVDALTDDHVPTAQGGARWYPSTIRAVLASVELDAA